MHRDNRRDIDAVRRKKKRKRTPEEIRRHRENMQRPQRDESLRRSSHNSSRNKEGKRKDYGERLENAPRRKVSFKKKILIMIAAVLCIIVGFIIISCSTFLLNVKNAADCEAVNPSRGEAVNILLLGMDIGDTKQTGNYDVKRTDTIMLLNYNPMTNKTKVVSIPRDTLITINGSNSKINAAFPSGGNELIKEKVEGLLDITVNYVMDIDYGAFRGFIDAIGGVNMKIERDMVYDDSEQDLHINFKAGTTVHLDGQKAEEFFRWRKNNDGTGFPTGDLGRIENQQKFLQKVVDKCKSPLIIFRINKILKVVASNMKTNMPGSKMLYYGAKILFSLKNGIDMTMLGGTAQYIGGISYFVYDKESNTELIESLVSGANASSDKKLDVKDAKVIILNCTNINGLAANAKTKLAEAGFSNIDTGNGEATEKSKVITEYSNLKDTVMEMLPNISKSIDESSSNYSNYDVVVLLGNDYSN